MDGNIIRGNIDTIILNILRNGELYGLEIISRVGVESGGTFELKKPTLYSALKRLQTDKYIKERSVPSSFGGDRKYFSLTDKGHAYLADKKFDWLFSKNVIDNLVLERDRVAAAERNQELETAYETVAAQKVSEFIASTPAPAVEQPAVAENFGSPVVAETREIETTEARTAVAVACAEPVERYTPSSPVVSVSAHAISPIEEYAARSSKYEIPMPTTPFINLPLTRGAPAKQLAFDMTKISTLDGKPLLRAVVKHAADPKSGRFVFYNRVRLASSAVTATIMAILLGIVFASLKPAYTFGESNFFIIGAVAIGAYFLSNVVMYFSQPRQKRAKTGANTIALRAGLSACFAVSAISLCVLFGAGEMNFMDFLVYSAVPCIVGSVFVLEGIANTLLKRVPYFLT